MTGLHLLTRPIRTSPDGPLVTDVPDPEGGYVRITGGGGESPYASYHDDMGRYVCPVPLPVTITSHKQAVAWVEVELTRTPKREVVAA